MSVIIEEMEIPKNCHECYLSYWDEENCEYWCPWHNCTVDCYGGEEKRMYDCPLKEVEYD